MSTVCPYLDASTAEIDEADLAVLHGHQEDEAGERSLGGPRIIPHVYGWWVNVQWQDRLMMTLHTETLKSSGFSKRFLALMRKAAKSQCNWINLDRDA